jgi:hypothetical protein
VHGSDKAAPASANCEASAAAQSKKCGGEDRADIFGTKRRVESRTPTVRSGPYNPRFHLVPLCGWDNGVDGAHLFCVTGWKGACKAKGGRSRPRWRGPRRLLLSRLGIKRRSAENVKSPFRAALPESGDRTGAPRPPPSPASSTAMCRARPKAFPRCPWRPRARAEAL